VAAIIDCRKHAEGTLIQFSGGHLPRKIRQGPVKAVRVHARLGLFFPPPRPSSGASQTAHKRGGRAPGANAPAGRARHPPRRAAPPERCRGGSTDYRGAPPPTGQPGSTSDISYNKAAHT